MSTRDFRAQQIETSKIIASGNLAAGKPLGIMIYSGSVATNRIGGVSDSAMLADVGTDVFMFISGSHKSKDAGNFTRTAATLFGGDVVISGTLYAERQVIEVDSVADGDLIVTGNLYVEPDTNSTTSVAFRNAAGVAIFNVDSTNKRIGIGDTSPDALLDVQGEAASGIPTLQIDHDDTDKVAINVIAANITADVLDISADAVTTAKVIDITADGLTTGNAIYVDDNSANTGTRNTVEIIQNNASATGARALKIQADSNGAVPGLLVHRNHSGTGAADPVVGIHVDLDQAGEVTSATAKIVGIDVEVETNSAADGIIEAFGHRITMSGDTDGTHTHTGLHINIGDADTNNHIEMVSKADTGDKCTISVGANGVTTLTTVDDDGANANLVFNIDGAIDLNTAAAFTLDAVGTSNVTTNGALTVSGSTGLSLHSHGGEVDITATQGLIDINAVAGSIDIDAGDNITLDAADDISLTTTTADGLITLHSAHTSGQAILIDANANAGSILDIDAGVVDADVQGNFTLDAGGVVSIDGVGASNVTTNGALTVSGSTGLNLASDSGEIDLTSRLGNIDINATAGNVTISAAQASNFTTSAGNLTLASSAAQVLIDAETDIVLDANGSDILLKDNNDQFGSISNSATQLIVSASKAKNLKLGTPNEISLNISENEIGTISGNSSQFIISSSAGRLINIDSNFGDVLFNKEGVQFGTISPDASSHLIISSSAGKDMILDANSGKLKFKKGTTEFLRISTSNNDAVIQPRQTDKDIIFKENATGGGDEVFRIDSSAKDILMAPGRNVSFGAATRFIGDGTGITSANDVFVAGSHDVILSPGANKQAFVSLGTNSKFGVGDNSGNTYLIVTGSSLGGILSSSVHNKNIMFHSNGGKEALSINGTGEIAFNDPGPLGSDVAFAVSGAIGRTSTANSKGVATFGGDLVVSGNTRLHGNIVMGGAGTTADSLYFAGAAQSGGPWIRGNSQVLTIDGDNRVDIRFSQQARFAADSGAAEVVQIFEPTATSLIEPQRDALQILSGSIGSRGTTTRGTTVFGGDVFVSGSTHIATGSAAKGLFLTSPDGSRFRINVDNSGNVTATKES